MNGWNKTVRTTSAIKSASMMTLTVSHQPSSFLTVGTGAAADFTVGSIIRVNTPFLEHSLGAGLLYKGGQLAPSSGW